MPVQLRAKGQYVQPGTLSLFPELTGGAVISVDGYLDLDSVYLQADYPDLFAVLGTFFNDPLKGDDEETQFRTPTITMPAVTGGRWLIRF